MSTNLNSIANARIQLFLRLVDLLPISQGPLNAYQLQGLRHLHHLRAFDLRLVADTGAPQLPGGFPNSLLNCTRLEALHISSAGLTVAHWKVLFLQLLRISDAAMVSRIVKTRQLSKRIDWLPQSPIRCLMTHNVSDSISLDTAC